MPLDKIVFLDQERLYVVRRSDGDFEKDTLSLADHLEIDRGYILVLPDSFVNLIYTDLTPVKRKRVREMVMLYLNSLYPEGTVSEQDFGYIPSTPVIAYLFTDRLKELLERYPALFQQARAVTTPSLIFLASERSPFILTLNDTVLIKKEDDFIHIIGEIEEYDSFDITRHLSIGKDGHEELIERLRAYLEEGKNLQSLDLNLSATSKESSPVRSLRTDMIFLGAIYLAFVIALVLSLIPYTKDIKAYKSGIDIIYKGLKIQNTNDPYGMLIFKLDRLKKETYEYPKPLNVLTAVSESFDKNSQITKLIANFDLIKIKGTTDSLRSLEKASHALELKLGIKFDTESAKVRNGKVNFVIVGRVRK